MRNHRTINFLLCFVFYIFNCIHAMKHPYRISSKKNMSLVVVEKNDHDLFKQRFEEKRHIIPLFSLKDMKSGYSMLDDKNRDYMSYKLSKSLFFSLALCPQEIKLKIFATMLDNDYEAAEEFDKIPILHAFEQYNKIKPYDPLMVGNKTYLIGTLFRLSVQQSDELKYLMSIANRSISERLIGKSYDLIDNDECKKIQQMPIHITKNLKLKVIRPQQYTGTCLFATSACCGISLFLWCLAPLYVAMGFAGCTAGGCCCIHHHTLRQKAEEVEL